MDDLIEALKIFKKYGPKDWRKPTNCSHDLMVICGVDPADVSAEDIEKLDELGFFYSEDEDGYFGSYRYGSC